ncbi:MAG: glycoside hydrolase family 28 protein [Bacteroidales bacterium]|nr:MAG: glycoside hydrolase family 28 protein [Bacteroidales bacterium]
MKHTGTLNLLAFILSQFLSLPACSMVTRDVAWEKADSIVENITVPVFPEKYYPITDFGAVPERNTLNTEAINKAIRTCSDNGGGTVLIPPGTFFSGPIQLRSNVNLHLEEGAVIKFSTNPTDYLPVVLTRWEGVDCYNYSPLIYALKEKNIAITGKGVLDGQANDKNWWIWKGRKEFGWEEGANSQLDDSGRSRLMQFEEKNIPTEQRIMGEGGYLRPPFIQFYNCNTILVENIFVKNAPFWIIHPLLSDNIIIRGITITSHGPNNDGCNPESCRNVLIEKCFFDTGDDCIAIKSGRNNDGRKWNIPSENIVIRGCKMQNGHGGVAIGSEISGGCRSVFIENCEMNSPDLERALRIKTNSYRGGTIEDIYARYLTIGEVKEAVIKFNCMYEIKDNESGNHIPVIRNIILENIFSENSKYALYIQGIKNENTIQNILIVNSSFDGVSNGNFLKEVTGLKLENVRINGVPTKF